MALPNEVSNRDTLAIRDRRHWSCEEETTSTAKNHRTRRLNPLLSNWKKGAIYTASWLKKQGIPASLTKKYRESHWIVSVGRGAFARSGDSVDWKGGLWAIQEQLGVHIHVGAKTALEMSGYGHYLSLGQETVTLFGSPNLKLPGWFKEYNFNVRLQYFTTNLFERVPSIGLTHADCGEFSITISSPERAIMEVLYLVPHWQSFSESWLLMEGLTNLRPTKVQQLLENCGSVKVKRLFMYMAEGLHLPWVARLNLERVDFGSGKRVIVKGGKLDTKYQITVPVSDIKDE
jgi:hypothetical protein